MLSDAPKMKPKTIAWHIHEVGEPPRHCRLVLDGRRLVEIFRTGYRVKERNCEQVWLLICPSRTPEFSSLFLRHSNAKTEFLDCRVAGFLNKLNPSADNCTICALTLRYGKSSSNTASFEKVLPNRKLALYQQLS